MRRLVGELRPYIHCAAACNFQERLAGMFDPQGPSHSARGSRDRVLPPPLRRQPNHRNREIFPRKCVYAPCHSSHPAEVEQGPNLPQNGRNSPSRGSVELQLCLYFRHCIPFSCLHNALIAFSNCMYLVTSEFILQLMAK